MGKKGVAGSGGVGGGRGSGVVRAAKWAVVVVVLVLASIFAAHHVQTFMGPKSRRGGEGMSVGYYGQKIHVWCHGLVEGVYLAFFFLFFFFFLLSLSKIFLLRVLCLFCIMRTVLLATTIFLCKSRFVLPATPLAVWNVPAWV